MVRAGKRCPEAPGRTAAPAAALRGGEGLDLGRTQRISTASATNSLLGFGLGLLSLRLGGQARGNGLLLRPPLGVGGGTAGSQLSLLRSQ